MIAGETKERERDLAPVEVEHLIVTNLTFPCAKDVYL